MNQGKYVFSQLISLLSHKKFQTIVKRHKGDFKVKDFTCWKQFLCMCFGQLTHRESLSDTILCLKANEDKTYHLGIGSVVSKSTLSTANENRSFRIYFDLAMLLIKEAKELSQRYYAHLIKHYCGWYSKRNFNRSTMRS